MSDLGRLIDIAAILARADFMPSGFIEDYRSDRVGTRWLTKKVSAATEVMKVCARDIKIAADSLRSQISAMRRGLSRAGMRADENGEWFLGKNFTLPRGEETDGPYDITFLGYLQLQNYNDRLRSQLAASEAARDEWKSCYRLRMSEAQDSYAALHELGCKLVDGRWERPCYVANCHKGRILHMRNGDPVDRGECGICKGSGYLPILSAPQDQSPPPGAPTEEK